MFGFAYEISSYGSKMLFRDMVDVMEEQKMKNVLIDSLIKCGYMKNPKSYGGTRYQVKTTKDSVTFYFCGVWEGLQFIRCFDFRARWYESKAAKYKVHGGFVDAFEKFVDKFDEYILAKENDRYRYKNIYIYGCSYGGALAMLLHEHAMAVRPDVRTKTYVLEVPKIFSKIDRIFHYRFTGLTIINMQHSLVSWLHPFRKNPVRAIKLKNDYRFGLEAHYPENIVKVIDENAHLLMLN